MNSKLLAAVAAASVMTFSTGCANMDRQTVGTVGGGAAGAVVGDAVFGNTLGTLGGAAAGAYIGNRVTDPDRR